MHYSRDPYRPLRQAVLAALCLLVAPLAVRADELDTSRGPAGSERLHRSLEFVQQGRFDQAADEIKKLDANTEMVRRVSDWLQSF